MAKRLANKTAIITGAAQGIGAGIAEVFAAEGANLILLDINKSLLSDLEKRLCTEYPSEILALAVDICSREAVEAAISRSLERFNKIDILVNNAGANVFRHPMDVTKNDWDKSLSLNLEGAWNCCQSILPHMLQNQYGHIVNVASVHGHKVVRGALPYAVAKHGLVGLTRVLGVEYAPQGIRVNSISPGLIVTPLTDSYFESCEDPSAERQRQMDILPCKKFGSVKDIANTALFLASDEATFINATDILVDGGRSQVYND